MAASRRQVDRYSHVGVGVERAVDAVPAVEEVGWLQRAFAVAATAV
jgi:hypothetical protein